MKGYKLVPVEPTEEMLEVLHSHVEIQVDARERTADIINDKKWWAAVVAAAPTPPQNAQPVAWIKADVAATLVGDQCCYAFGSQNPKGSLVPLYAHADAVEVERHAQSQPIYDETAELEKFSTHWKLEARIYRDKNTHTWLPTRDTLEGFQMAERVHALWLGWESCAQSRAKAGEVGHE